MKAFITSKIGMASMLAEDGTLTAVTLLSATPMTVTQVKTQEKDGYTAVQVGVGENNKSSKSVAGHLQASKAKAAAIREFRVNELTEDLTVGTPLTAEVFSVGDVVKVTGTSKGKGWAGTIKRHNFHRQRKTHGGKGNTRKPGSIGSMYPQHILKGKKMAGQLGDARVTVKNLKIAIVDTENNVIGVTGAVPGPRKGLVLVQGAKE
jgi:large subunit ribosomal protein L3